LPLHSALCSPIRRYGASAQFLRRFCNESCIQINKLAWQQVDRPVKLNRLTSCQATRSRENALSTCKPVNLSTIYLHRCGRHGLAALDAATLHQAIVLPHQQLGFYLLQSIQHHTHHDQQRSAAEESGEAG